MGMVGESGNLSDLRDIVVPGPAPWWPLAPGWYVLFVVVAAVAGYLGFRAYSRYQANAYRREAKALLERAQSDAEISAVLKRAAMVVEDRRKVAALTGDAWCEWLDGWGVRAMTAEERSAMEAGFYDEGRSKESKLRDYALQWVEGHQAGKRRNGGEVPA